MVTITCNDHDNYPTGTLVAVRTTYFEMPLRCFIQSKVSYFWFCLLKKREKLKKKKEKEMGEKLSVLNSLTLLKSAGEGSCR